MVLEIQQRKKEEPQMDEYEVTERLCLTEDDRVVPEGDADARWLYATPGQRIPLDEARRYGLVPDDGFTESDDETTVSLTEEGERIVVEDAPVVEETGEPATEEPTDDAPAVVFPPEVKRSRRK